MQMGMVGLGRMGANMVRRLMGDGHDVVVYDVRAESVDRDGAGRRCRGGLAGRARREAGTAASRLDDGSRRVHPGHVEQLATWSTRATS